MTTEYLHGVRAIEVDDGIRPIRRTRSSIIGLIGTAPEADPETFPLDEPVLVPGNTRMAALLGAEGTLKDAIDAIYAQIGAVVIVVRVADGEGLPETISNVIGDPVAKTGVHALQTSEQKTGFKPRILIAPGFTSVRPTTGIAAIAVDEGGEGYTTAPEVTIEGDGTGATAVATVVDGAVTGVTVVNPGIGYTEATVVFGGPGEGAEATASIGDPVANPVVAAMLGVARSLRAIVLADGPNTTNTAAITYRGDWGSDRLMVLDPHPLAWDTVGNQAVTRPASAYAAGVQAFMDNARGFWWPFSNQPVNGVVGVSRPIGFSISDANSEHNLLNEQEVTVLIRSGGFRFFGLRSTGTDPLWAFLSVRRIADMVMDEIEAGHLWALDRPFSQQLVRELVEGVNAYLRVLRTEGAIVDGRCWLNPDFNEPGQLVEGKLTLDFDIEPVAPIERITFRVHRNPDYYAEAVEEIVRAVAA